MTIAYPTGRSFAGLSRPAAFAVVSACYVVGGAAALVTTLLLRHHHPITVAFVADLVATVVVFLLSMVLANSSLYDPYWSVVPPVVAIAWAAVSPHLGAGAAARQVIVVVLVVVWAIRLTGNWAIGWHGLTQEDWRYVMMRDNTHGRLPWWLVSFVGVQLVPTLFVFIGMLPLWPSLGAPRHSFNVLDVLAAFVTATAIAVETIADNQMRAFVRNPENRGRTIDVGLWSRSRHPNYLGEIGMWCGLYLFGLAADPHWWWTIAGPAAMVLLFETASIPMMEDRSLQRRPEYADYQRRVPRLLPIPRRP